MNPERAVTFVVDTNPNYTNVCTIDCIFCAFYRHPGEEGEYTYSVDHMIAKFKESAAKGVTTVLLQGGVHPALPFEYYLELVERTVKEVPEIHPHFFSTSEILGMAQISGLSVPEVLQRLWDAGLRSIPGGGAEILSDRVKKKISHLKGTSADWLAVMREAHRIGYKTTATMMYGHLENDEDIIEHLEVVRQLQDEYHGFTAFVPWSFKPGNTPLEKIIPHYATPTRYLQMIALLEDLSGQFSAHSGVVVFGREEDRTDRAPFRGGRQDTEAEGAPDEGLLLARLPAALECGDGIVAVLLFRRDVDGPELERFSSGEPRMPPQAVVDHLRAVRPARTSISTARPKAPRPSANELRQ